MYSKLSNLFQLGGAIAQIDTWVTRRIFLGYDRLSTVYDWYEHFI
ncbi:hypothetical protein [Allocoleopsis sp.]